MEILIVDDHAVVRRGLRMILSAEPDMTVTAEACSTLEMLHLLRHRQFDVVVLDISMPGRSGLDALTELKGRRRELPVLVLSIHPEDQFALRVLRAGASGYLTKESAPEELVHAVRHVCSGRRYISATLAQKLAGEVLDGTARAPHEFLSDREYEVLRLMGAGKSVSEIAGDLCLSVKTVSTYRARLLEKLGLTTTAALVRYALTHGLAD